MATGWFVVPSIKIHLISRAYNMQTYSKKMGTVYDTNFYLMMRLQLYRFEECGVAFSYYYSQVHSDLEW